MTREEAKELLPIIQAFAEGKEIEMIMSTGKWGITDLFCPDLYEYRIKPKPKYRPFKTQEECWNEMHKHPDFGWVRNKATGSVAIIGNISTNTKGEALIIWATNQECHYAMLDVFNDYTFTDGAPFGIKE